MQYFKKFDFYGKNVTFYYGSSTFHRTIFGGLLSIFTFSLMMTITITSLYNFLYQKPLINSNVVFFINKKFSELEGMEIKGQIINDNNENEDTNQLEEFLKYYRIVLHEKYFDELETYHVARITKINNNIYQFNVEKHISDVFKEKEFSSLKIVSCYELLQNDNTKWPKEKKIENRNKEKQNDIFSEDLFPFDNSASMCLPEYPNFFNKSKNEEINFTFSFDTPIYTVDRKGNLHKTPHLNQFKFRISDNLQLLYSIDTKYIVIEDDSNIYYTKKKYDVYITINRPVLINEKENDGFSMIIDLQNKNNEQIILITVYKYKLLDFLAKLGGIMKIITIVKMTGTFWSSYFYEKTLYKLIVKRKNPYLEQKRLLLEPTLRKISSKNVILNKKKFDPETSSVRSQNSVNFNYTLTTNYNNTGPFILPDKTSKKYSNEEYCSYFAWVMNKFCKIIYSLI